MSGIRILIADDHEIICAALKLLLEHEGLQVVAETTDGHEAVRLAELLQPDLAVLSVELQPSSSIDASAAIRVASPQTRTLLLTKYADPLHVRHALAAGVNGYVLKSQPRLDLLRAIDAVARGGSYLSPGISGAVLEMHAAGGRRRQAAALTSRERQVFHLIADGKSTREIALLLGVSFKTAESHRTRIMRKLDVHNTASLVRYAAEHHLL